MERFNDYEIVDFGIDHPGYFQGIGSTQSYIDACYGIGMTYSEALNDALDMMVSGDEDTRMLAADIERDELVPGVDEDRPCADPDDDQRFYHVGIRWNL